MQMQHSYVDMDIINITKVSVMLIKPSNVEVLALHFRYHGW